MPDLQAAKFAETQKLAAKRAAAVKPPVTPAEKLPFSLAQEGLPLRAATLIAIHFAKLDARIAELEKAARPVHLRKTEKRNA